MDRLSPFIDAHGRRRIRAARDGFSADRQANSRSNRVWGAALFPLSPTRNEAAEDEKSVLNEALSMPLRTRKPEENEAGNVSSQAAFHCASRSRLRPAVRLRRRRALSSSGQVIADDRGWSQVG